MSAIIDLIGSLFQPAVDLVDEVHTSDEEKEQLQNQLFELQSTVMSKVMEYESKTLDAKASIIKAEAQGTSWLQRNWRPILMLSIVAIVVNNYILFPYLSMFTDKVVMLNLPDKLFTLMTVGVGGYVAGRSGEKIMKAYKR